MDPWLLCLLQCVKMVILQIDFHFQKWMKLWGGKSNEWACSEKLLHWCDQKIPALIVCSDLVIDDTLIFRRKLSGHYSRTVLTLSTWGTSSHCTTQWIFKTWCACSWTYSSHDAQPSVLETVDSSSETWLKLLIISIARAPSLINSDDALHMKFKPVWKRDLLQVCGAEHSSKNRPSRERSKNISCVAVDFYWLLLVNL